MHFRLAIYDWNGTLFNDLLAAYGAVRHIFKTVAPRLDPPTLEEYRNEIASNFTDFYYAHGIPKSVSGDEMNDIWIPFYEKQASGMRLNDGAKELLRRCKVFGLRNAIVSASPENLENTLARFGILSLFDKVRSRAWPKIPALKETLEYFGVRPDEAFYIDDTFDGIASARNLGLCTIGFTGGYNSRERVLAAGPDRLVDSLRDAITILDLRR